MAFKLKQSNIVSTAPINKIDMEDGVLGKADRNGSILINKNITDPNQLKETIEHEKIHLKQMKEGRLDYDDENIYWEGKIIKRKNITEGSPALAWEIEANKK